MPYFGDRNEHAAFEIDMDDMGVSSRRLGDVDAIMDNLGDGLDPYGHDFGDDGSDDFELYEDDDWSDFETDYAVDALEGDDPYADIAI
ncbi:MAG: hypothetical protein AAFN16_12120 [Pseudomonadota bacterium]